VSDIAWEQSLALGAVIVATGTPWFFVFWTWFDFWRKHRVLTYSAMALTFGVVAAFVIGLHHLVLGARLHMPGAIRTIGWLLIGVSAVFGFVADRQIGVRVRSFLPFFDTHGHIELKTTGAYGVVRHPIYAAGCIFELGVFLATGYPSVLVACAIFGLGARWFSRQEEMRLMSLLDDPEEYVRYRQRVPALFPRLRRSNA
jgi:protein-S-isoprenylcysteine O-methyltransferase Ste14